MLLSVHGEPTLTLPSHHLTVDPGYYIAVLDHCKLQHLALICTESTRHP